MSNLTLSKVPASSTLTLSKSTPAWNALMAACKASGDSARPAHRAEPVKRGNVLARFILAIIKL